MSIFKYYNFFVGSFLELFNITNIDIILPIGISFYIFSSIGYLVDVYYNDINMDVTLFEEALYILFFPKLLQGPFQKSEEFFRQTKYNHSITKDNIEKGSQIFLFGLIKKIVIADRLGLFVDAVYSAPSAYNGATLLLVVFTYPIQIYCDFSGYTDMAIGVSNMMGYEIPSNFNLPFLSQSVEEYWHRWHMSLNIWFRNYLFFPIMRNYKISNLRKKAKQMGINKNIANIIPSIISLSIVWPLIGLWHGESWNYLIYGCYYGILMIFSILFNAIVSNYSWRKHKWLNVLRIVRTHILTIVIFVIFRAETLQKASTIFKGIFYWQSGISYIYSWAIIFIPVVWSACLWAYAKNMGNSYYIILNLSTFKSKVIISFVVFMTLILMCVGNNYFMYFQF